MNLCKYYAFITGFVILCAGCNFPGNTLHQGSDLDGGVIESSGTLTEEIESVKNPDPVLPPVVGSEPSDRVGTFYYPWYRTPEIDGFYDHWGDGYFSAPMDIPSDYYPSLGPYSVGDPEVLAQHFAWHRRAGVGLIVSSWWGQGSNTDKAFPLILDMADHYGIKVAFHIEPYHGRTAERLVYDIKYLYKNYGDHPAFFRTTAKTRWSNTNQNKGLFFVWAIIVPDTESESVDAEYWQEAIDEIHDLPDGGIIIANTVETDWVDRGHFDGLYNYITLHLKESGGFSWAKGLPPDAWYVPSVMPGASAIRIGYPPEDYVPRNDGITYDNQWIAALSTGVEPTIMTITSFNEWHEGTQIEPAKEDFSNGRGYTYDDYSPLPRSEYLDLTRKWVEHLAKIVWEEPIRVRIRLMTTSDWTTLRLATGATWLRPDIVFIGDGIIEARMEGDRFLLSQDLSVAESGSQVEVIFDILLNGVEIDEILSIEIERGHIGATWVEVLNLHGDEPTIVDSFVWEGINPGERNSTNYTLNSNLVFAEKP